MKPGSSDGLLTLLASILVSAVLFAAQHFTSAPRTNFNSAPDDNLADATASAQSDSEFSDPLGGPATNLSRTASSGNAPNWTDSFDQPFSVGNADPSSAAPDRLPSAPQSTNSSSAFDSRSVAANDSRSQTRTFGSSTSSGSSSATDSAAANSSAAASAKTYKVISIIDGDTVDLLVDRQPLRLRLSGIDTPEKGQPFGNTAKDVLSKAIGGKNVQYVVRDTDRYGRSIADVYFRGVHINKWLVQKGLAWHYKAYSSDVELAEAEQAAAAARRGLWADPRRIAPWNWRKLSKVERDQYR